MKNDAHIQHIGIMNTDRMQYTVRPYPRVYSVSDSCTIFVFVSFRRSQAFDLAKKQGYVVLRGTGYRKARKGSPLLNIYRQFCDAKATTCTSVLTVSSSSSSSSGSSSRGGDGSRASQHASMLFARLQ